MDKEYIKDGLLVYDIVLNIPCGSGTIVNNIIISNKRNRRKVRIRKLHFLDNPVG